MGQIKCCEAFSSRQSSEKLINTGQWVCFCLCKLINYLFKISTNSDGAIFSSFLTIGTMGVAQCENLIMLMIPADSSLSNSAETLSCKAKGTCLALKNCGLASSFRYNLTLDLLKVPNSSVKTDG